MVLVDEFGKIVTEQLEDESPSVSTPKTVATILSKYSLAEIMDSENCYVDFAELAMTIRDVLACSFLGKKRNPDISDEKAKTIDQNARDLLRKMAEKYERGYGMNTYKGIGETFVIYVIDVPSSVEIYKKINPSSEKTRLELFLAYNRDILEYLEGNMQGITGDKGSIPYIG